MIANPLQGQAPAAQRFGDDSWFRHFVGGCVGLWGGRRRGHRGGNWGAGWFGLSVGSLGDKAFVLTCHDSD